MRTTMTIGELYQEKEVLEEAILSAIKKFTEKTGAVPEYIDLEYDSRISVIEKSVNHVRVTLPLL